MAIHFLKILILTCLYVSSSLVKAEVDAIIIGGGDVLIIDVYNERDLYVKAKIPKSGVLRIPLLGDIKVTGKTSQQLSKELELAYMDGYLVEPSVSVVVESYRPFFIRGAVTRAGVYEFQYDLTVDQAIAIAGGLKDRASKRNWFIIRGIEKKRAKVSSDSRVLPGDIVEIEESIF